MVCGTLSQQLLRKWEIKIDTIVDFVLYPDAFYFMKPCNYLSTPLTFCYDSQG